MPRKGGNPFLSGYEEIFSGARDGPDVQHERVQQIPLSELHPFEGHPFRVVDDEEMQKTVESVKQYGVLTPAIARPDPDGGYEIISGHRRMRACELAGIKTLPVIVRDMDDDTAIIFMVDANLQREHILPSERAFAYRMKMEAIKHQGERTDLSKDGTCAQVGHKSDGKRSRDIVAEEAGVSKNQVSRYIRLTELIPEIRDMVDEKKIAFNPAVELSYLKPEEQKEFLEAMDYAQTSPSLSQAQRIKRMSQEGQCTLEQMCDVMNELKKDDMTTVTISHDVLRKYFPKSYTPQQMQDVIVKLLDQWQKKRNRDQSR
ncbi:MAG: ParB/RepB/Spo0J family partition protein [Lachnospiraceae bacterium]|jgi:ParB family chromosome partitioning protein